jgi:hypothetical protein
MEGERMKFHVEFDIEIINMDGYQGVDMGYIILAFIAVVIISGIALYIFNNKNRWSYNRRKKK